MFAYPAGEALDLTTSTGRAMAGILSVFDAFEHDILLSASGPAWTMPGKAAHASEDPL